MIRRTRADSFSQLALPLGWAEGEDARKMVLGPCNRAAIDLLTGGDTWHSNGAILTGPPRCGKSKLGAHLADNGAVMFIDDANGLDDEALFHQWNRARGEGKAPLLAARTPPGEWGVTLPDLQSRLNGAAMVSITEPDEAFLRALIPYHLALLGGSISGEALDFALHRLPRTHAMAERFAAEANARALSERRAITLPLVRDMLRAWEDAAQLTLDDDL